MTHATATDELARKYAEAITTAEIVSAAAHDLGHQVFSLCSQAEDLVRELRSTESSRSSDMAENLLESAVQLQHTLSMIRRIRSGSPDTTRFEIRDIVDRVFDMLRSALARSDIAARVRIEPGLAIFGSPEQLMAVLSNLALNSIQALQDAPRKPPREISVEARRVSGLGDPKAKDIEILFADTGPGISPAFSEPDQIFEFGTTSYENKTGFGLPISRAVVERSFAGTLDLARVKPAVLRVLLTDAEGKAGQRDAPRV